MSSVFVDRKLSRRKTVKDLLERNGGYHPCTGKELCPACQIFGMMEKTVKSGTRAYGSKVRITDARLIHPVKDGLNLFEKPIILPELGEPKPETVEFYTKSPYTAAEAPKGRQGHWTYDLKRKINGNSYESVSLKANQPELRGRKFYWHSDVCLKNFKNTGLSAMKQRVRPMKAGDRESEPLFHFRIYFEQLSMQQLSQLKWALDFGNSECAHKIGRAKPLGFGSVQMIVDEVTVRKIDPCTGCLVMENLNLEPISEEMVQSNEALYAVSLMTNWEKRPENVKYPLGEAEKGSRPSGKNAQAAHQWFRLNRGKVSKPEFRKVLPEAKEDFEKDLDQKKALYKLIEKSPN